MLLIITNRLTEKYTEAIGPIACPEYSPAAYGRSSYTGYQHQSTVILLQVKVICLTGPLVEIQEQHMKPQPGLKLHVMVNEVIKSILPN